MIARLYGSLTALVLTIISWFSWNRLAVAGDSLVEVAFTGIAIFLLINGVVPAVTCFLSKVHSWRPDPELHLGFVGTIRWFLREWASAVILFAAAMPLHRLLMGSDTVSPLTQHRTPVLLVHGYLCNRGFWWWIRRHLQTRGYTVATVNLEPPFADIADFVEQLRQRIDAVRQETGAATVYLVGHSMGGLVIRGYIKRHGTRSVGRVITLGTPHRGTRLASLGLGRNARSMRPNSDWLKASSIKAPPVPILSIWSARDNFVLPQDSGRLTGAREVILKDVGHLSMAFSIEVVDAIDRELTVIDQRATG
jgi:triacylglycerol lipase